MSGGAPLTLAFVGCGAITRRHARTLRSVAPGVALAYASRDAARAERFRQELGGVAAFGSYEAAFADPRVGAVLIATPPSSHRELTLAALRGGKHALVEKPPFMRSEEVDEVEALARERGLQVGIAENYAYRPLLRRLRALVAEGALGEIRFVQVNALKSQRTEGWRDLEELAGGGALFEGGIHWVAFLAGLGLAIDSAEGYFPGPPKGLERSALLVARYAGGAVGTLHYSWEVPSPLRGLRWSRIFGTEGTATFESNGLFLCTSGRRPGFAFPGFRDIGGQRAMFRDFVAAVGEGRAPEYGLPEARRDLRLIEQAYRSLPR